MNNNSNILYYYVNMVIAIIIIIGSFFMRYKYDNGVVYAKNNVLEVSEVGNLIINKLNDNNYYEGVTLNMYNKSNVDSNYELIYRIEDSNININNLLVYINGKMYDAPNIVVDKTDEYIDLLIDSSKVGVNNNQNISFSLIINNNNYDKIYIEGSYVIESINSRVVFV